MDNMLAIRTGSGISFVDFHDILYCRADGRYTHVYLNNGKSVLTARLLKTFENKLPDDVFIRIHKSYIININCISNFRKGNNVFTVKGTSTELEVAKRRRKILLDKLDSTFTFV